MALNYSLETERAFRPIVEEVQESVRSAKPEIAEACVAVLRGPRSLWPVDTGLSKRSWKVRRRAGQASDRPFATIINTAIRRRPSGTRTYAQFVNAGIGWGGGNVKHKMVVERTIEAERRAIVATVEAQLAAEELSRA